MFGIITDHHRSSVHPVGNWLVGNYIPWLAFHLLRNQTANCHVTSSEQRRGLFDNRLFISPELHLSSHSSSVCCSRAAPPPAGRGQSELGDLQHPAVSTNGWRLTLKDDCRATKTTVWEKHVKYMHADRQREYTVISLSRMCSSFCKTNRACSDFKNIKRIKCEGLMSHHYREHLALMSCLNSKCLGSSKPYFFIWISL